MAEQIDKIINNLNQLKQKNSEKEKELAEMLKGFEEEKKTIDLLTKKLTDTLTTMSDDLSQISQTKRGFIDKLKVRSFQADEYNQDLEEYKVFKVRESLLTEMFRHDSFKTLYNIFFSIMILLLGNFIFMEYFNKEIFDYKLFKHLFEGFELTIIYSFKFYFFSLLFIVFLQIYKKVVPFFNEMVALCLYLVYFLTLLLYFLYKGKTLELSFVCRFIYYIELVRNIAKVFSYLAEKFLFLTYRNQNEKKEEISIMDFIIVNAINGTNEFHFKKTMNLKREVINFTYFYFAPTMIYRDSYPSNSQRNYTLICIHFMNFLFCILFTFLVFKIMLIPYFEDTTLSFMQKNRFIQTLVSVIIGSNFNMLILFFGLAHSWLNLWAEILGFSDKKFYKSFWTATTPVEYYRGLIYNVSEYFEYIFVLYFKIYLGVKVSGVIMIVLFGFFLDYALYYSLGFFSPVLSSLIIICHIISIPMSYLKFRSTLLINFMLTTLGFGIFFLLELAGYYVTHKSQIHESESLIFWRNHIPSIILFK